MRRVSPRGLTVLAAVAMTAAITGCGAKGTEPFHDAKRSGVVNSAPADLVTMPDGYSNAATKCDHGNRLYVLFHSDGSYGAIFAVPKDPSCR